MIPRTKIVCTLGPASDPPEVLRAMIRAGMRVARINFSHGDQAVHAYHIDLVRQIAQEERRVVAVLGDLQGPRWRVGDIEGSSVPLIPGQPITLTTRPVPGSPQEVYLLARPTWSRSTGWRSRTKEVGHWVKGHFVKADADREVR